jgi:hypothetical protein
MTDAQMLSGESGVRYDAGLAMLRRHRSVSIARSGRIDVPETLRS